MKFHGGEIAELAASFIVESMYSQCDFGGNKYLLLESFINHRKNDSFVSEEGQKVIV